MTGEPLLDTNAMIAFLGNDIALRQRVAQSARLLLATAVLGELYYGAFKSARGKHNLDTLEGLSERSVLVQPDTRTAREYGAIKNELRIKGRPIPEGDLWIAAIARQHGFTLISRDQHFAVVDMLNWEEW